MSFITLSRKLLPGSYRRRFFPSMLAGACLTFSAGNIAAQAVSLTSMATTYTQDFNTLSNVAGSTTNNLTISGWFMTESGGGARDNEQYAVDTGASTTGDTYSYGAAGSTERALGELRSGTLIPNFGAAFTNNTGSTIGSLAISFTGEEWRLGTAGRTDQLNFEYSLNATDLVTGTWISVSSLNFVTPDNATAGAKNGNAAADRTLLSTTISSLSIANGATFWIRWTDVDASGADDGLGIDDFSLTPQVAGSPEIDVVGNGLSITSGDNTPSVTDSTDFGDVNVCSGSRVQTYTVSNSGTAQLNLNGTPAVIISGTNASDFVVSSFPSALAIGTASSAVFSIQFHPSAAGVRTAVVTIPNDDSDENPYTFTIQGNGLGVSLTASVTTTDITCNGLTNGSATVAAAGNGTLNYDWMPGSPTGDGTANVSSLGAGSYTLTVTDANTCSVSKTFTINEPASITATVAATGATCNGGSTGSATVTAAGGTGALSYTWAPAGGNSNVASNLSAGIYSVTITDVNSCSLTQTVSVSEPSAVAVTAMYGTILCNGGNTTVTVSATGGTPSYSGTGTFTATAGTYTYVVTDNNSCAGTATLTVSEPSVVVATATATPIACNGGNAVITVTASGGTPSYAGTGNFTVTANSYTYTVTDANSCAATATITVNEPALLTASVTAGSIFCNGGNTTVTVTANGGTPAYSGTGTFTVTANSYTYTVTDANSCQATTAITVNEPAALTASVTASTILCNGESAMLTVSASGGTPAYTGTGSFTVTAGSYTYTVTDNNSCSATTTITVSQPAAIASSQTLTICSGQSVTVGTHTYTSNGSYTDVFSAMNGCDSTVTTDLVVNLLPVLSASITPSSTICNGTSVTLEGVGATSYTWSTGVIDGVAFTPTATATYTLSGTNANSCSDSTTITVTVNQLPVVTLSSTSNTLCVNDGPAALTGSPTGGTYGGTGVSGNSFDPAVSGVGTFTLTYAYTDGNSCSASAITVVTVDGCTAVGKTSDNSELNVYPNPFSSLITIHVNGVTKETSLSVFNLMGESVYQTTVGSDAVIDLGAHRSGVYYIQIKTDKGILTKKVIKQ